MPPACFGRTHFAADISAPLLDIITAPYFIVATGNAKQRTKSRALFVLM